MNNSASTTIRSNFGLFVIIVAQDHTVGSAYAAAS